MKSERHSSWRSNFIFLPRYSQNLTVLLAVLVPLVAIAICFVLAQKRGRTAPIANPPPLAEQITRQPSPASLVFDVRTCVWASDGTEGFEKTTIEEAQAEPGGGIGHVGSFLRHGNKLAPPFILLEIVDKGHVKVRIASGLVKEGKIFEEKNQEELLVSGGSLVAHTPMYDAGETYTLRISDLKSAPIVRADSPEVVAALRTRAEVIKDDRGSVQNVGPHGMSTFRSDTDEANRERWRPLDAEFWDNLAKLNNLRRLNLCGSNAKDDDLRCIEHFPRLIYLALSGSKITDEGMKQLAGLQRLEELYLIDTNVGDESVQWLSRLSHLKIFRSDQSKITCEGLWEMQLALPRLRVGNGHDSPWGQLVRSGHAIGPLELVHENGELNRRILQLLVLGCTLCEDAKNGTFSASLSVPREKRQFELYRTNLQNCRAIQLLAQLGNVTSLAFQNRYAEPQSPPIDDGTISAMSKLLDLKKLGLARCALTDTAWLQLAQLTQLQQLDLDGATISGAMVRNLQKAFPGCAIGGRPSSDTKTPVPDFSQGSSWRQLRAQFPGKSDRDIARKLRSYIVVDESDKGEDAGWILQRLFNAREQWQAVKVVEECHGVALYDYQFGASHELDFRAKSTVPAPLREVLGDDFFHRVLAVERDAVSPFASRNTAPANDRWLISLAALPHLRWLRIDNLRNDDNLKYLADLAELKTLLLDHGKFTGEGLDHLKRLPQLHNLWIMNAEGLTPSGLAAIAQLPHLRSVDLAVSRLPDLAEANLDAWTEVEELNLSSNNLTAAGVAQLKKLPKLRVLNLYNCSHRRLRHEDGDSKAEQLKGLIQLQKLDLSMNGVTDAGLQHLSGLSSLSDLTLSCSPGITDAGIKHLLRLTQLRHLEIVNTSITNDGLKQLAPLPLECLKITGTHVTGDGLETLKGWPHLAHLAIDGTQAEAYGVKDLSELRQLKELDIYSATGKHLDGLQKAMPNCKVTLFP